MPISKWPRKLSATARLDAPDNAAWRCRQPSTVGDSREKFSSAILDLASSLRVGNGLDADVQMGPVISPDSKTRIERSIATGIESGGQALLDGRGPRAQTGSGNFLRPTVLTGLGPDHVFGHHRNLRPGSHLGACPATLDDAIATISKNAYGNAASIFTTSGVAARKFRYEVPTGNVGVNIGVAAPMAYFPFSGWKDSFLGVLHGQGRDAVEFYTDKKVVIERWPKEWSRKF